jgi:type II secretory pathway pseudopilin PulG
MLKYAVKKQGLTLVETLLVVMISALVMAAIVPFIRSVASSWQAGSGKQEILQNGRTALETMTRYIRQAKRITAIPGASGSYIKIRDPEDTYNIVFYHNVSGLPYYSGETADIKNNDLVMRSNKSGTDVNTMLAPAVTSLNFIFLKDDRNPASKANEVKSMQIQISLNDPTGSISYTLALEDTVTWRQDVREAIWVINSGGSSPLYDKLTDIAYRATVGGFRITSAASNCLSANPKDFSCWVADRTVSTPYYVKKVSSAGQVEWTVTGFNRPRAVSVNYNPNWSVNGKETVWVADTSNSRVLRLVWWTASNTWTSSTAAGGANLSGLATPSSVSVNSDWTVNGKETCWVAEATTAKRVRRIYWTTTGSGFWTSESITGTNTTFNTPYSVSVNPNDISYNKESCWVAYTGGNSVRRIYAASATTWTYDTIPGTFSGPRSVSVNPNEVINNRNTCWVADTGGNRIRKIYWTGTVWTYANFAGFNSPYSVSVNPADDTCWVADYGNNRVVRLGASGNIEWSASDNIEWSINRPMAVSVSPNY